MSPSPVDRRGSPHVDRRRHRERVRTLGAWIFAMVASIAPLAIGWASHAVAAVGDCVPPTVSYDGGSARRGDTIRVVGTAWGDDCLDTPTDEPDPGPLGQPLEDIEVFIAQGQDEVLVARGAADDRYRFEVEVPVPSELESGPVSIVARANGTVSVDNSPGTLTISDEAPVSTSWAVVEFGPAPDDGTSTTSTTSTTTTTTEPVTTSAAPSTAPQNDSSGTATGWIVVASVVAVAAACALALWWVRRARRDNVDDNIR